MPNSYLQGIQTAFDNQAEIRNNGGTAQTAYVWAICAPV